MALTNLSQVTSSGIHTLSNYTTHNINSTGIITATSFSGNLSSASGISTFAEIRVTGNLTVEGTTTTLDSNLTEVDRIEVGANAAAVGVAVTQSGTGHVATFEGGNVGIGTDNPSQKLQVNGAMFMAGDGQGDGQTGIEIGFGSPGVGTAHHRIRTAGGTGQNLTFETQTASAGGDVVFKTGGVSNRLRITSDGNVSIGSLTDDSIGSTTTLTIDRSSGNGQISFAANGTVRGRIFADNSTSDFRIGNPTSNDLMLYTNNLERLRIDSNGRQSFYTDGSLRMHLNATGLGVNTNTITGGRLIHAHNTGTGSAYFQSTNSNTGEGNSSGAVYGVSGTTCYAPWNYINGPIVFATNSSEKMRIHATGEVTKSSQPLAVIGTTQNNPTPSAGSIVQFDYAATNRGNHYNTSNYTFTCPVAGDYMVIFRHSRKGWCGDLDLQKNGTTHAYLELRETGLNGAGTPVPDWQAGSYSFIVPCAANDVLRWRVGAVYTSTGSGGYLLDGYNHIKYDAVTYYLIG